MWTGEGAGCVGVCIGDGVTGAGVTVTVIGPGLGVGVDGCDTTVTLTCVGCV